MNSSRSSAAAQINYSEAYVLRTKPTSSLYDLNGSALFIIRSASGVPTRI